MNQPFLICLRLLCSLCLCGESIAADWLLGKAYKLPSEYTNQESGYFSIIEGQNGKLYIGSAKYGVNAYLLEFDPKTEKTKMVMDVHEVIGSKATGFAAQAKIHTRNNVGAVTGKIYVGSKQGYPEKGESRDLTPAATSSPTTRRPARTSTSASPRPKHGIISVTPDEAPALAYISTCSDDRPIDHTHFMVLDLKTKKYRTSATWSTPTPSSCSTTSTGRCTPIRGGTSSATTRRRRRSRSSSMTVDGKPVPKELSKDGRDPELGHDARPQDALLRRDDHQPALRLRPDARPATRSPGRPLGKLLAARQGDRLPGDVRRRRTARCGWP